MSEKLRGIFLLTLYSVELAQRNKKFLVGALKLQVMDFGSKGG